MAEEARHAGRGDNGLGGPSSRVLVVEEDRVEGGMLAFHLRREGLAVMLASSGDEAIDALAWATPDAVLVEAHGRELDGFAVLRALGEASVRVFLLADGPLELDEDLEALRLGVSDIFTKPVDATVVARRVLERPLLSRRGSLPDLPDAGISGDLELHPVTSLLSLCRRHRMNARLHVELDGDWGVLLVRHGEIIDAESPGATGRDAALAAIRRARGTFVLFPLTLDAEELSRDDVVRSDLAALLTEALGRPDTRSSGRVVPTERQVELTLPATESPRGPLSRSAHRPEGPGGTLEYEATPTPPAPIEKAPGPDTRARIQRQVGLPSGAPPPPAAAPAPVEEREPLDRSTNAPRRRVTTGAQVRERASQIRRPTRPMPVSTPAAEPVKAAQEPITGRDRRPSTRPPEAVAAGVRRPEGSTAERGQGPATVIEAAARPAMPPELPASARMPRPASERSTTEPAIDEPTDMREKSPMQDAPRVRRPSTGMFAIGDPKAPKERTDVEVNTETADRAEGSTAGRRWPHWSVWAAAALLLAALVLVVARLAAAPETAPGPALTAPAAAPDAATAARLRFGEAATLLRVGDRAKAEPLFEALVGEADRPDGALAGLAMIYLRAGRLDEAEPVLEALNRQRKDDPQVKTWLGILLARQGRIEDARAHFEAARRSAAPALAERLDALLETLP